MTEPTVSSSSGARFWSWLSWFLVLAAVLAWTQVHHVGWDVAIYRNAIQSIKAGHDPYAEAMAVQTAYRRTLGLAPNAQTPLTPDTPFSYVYSPITLPLLRVMGALPAWLDSVLYGSAYVAGVLAMIWVGTQAFEPGQSRVFHVLAPAAVFLPGLCQHDTVLSGNVAFILYGLVLAAACLGWKRGRWWWFYAAVLLASCVKAPLLSLAIIPVLSARRQWRAAGTTVVAGIVLFGLQSLIWPTLFRHYLQAVELQFTYNRDFGCSPAGLVSQLLADQGIAYSPASTVFYLAYALLLCAVLLYLSRRFLDGGCSLEQWIPVLLVGVILLNPRIMQYDVAPLTVPLALILWRALRRRMPRRPAMAILLVLLGFANYVVFQDLGRWKLMEGSLLMVLFVVGAWDVSRRSPFRRGKRASDGCAGTIVQLPAPSAAA